MSFCSSQTCFCAHPNPISSFLFVYDPQLQWPKFPLPSEKIKSQFPFNPIWPAPSTADGKFCSVGFVTCLCTRVIVKSGVEPIILYLPVQGQWPYILSPTTSYLSKIALLSIHCSKPSRKIYPEIIAVRMKLNLQISIMFNVQVLQPMRSFKDMSNFNRCECNFCSLGLKHLNC